MPFRKFMNLNIFFTHKKDGKSFFQLLDKEAADLIAKDYESLIKRAFRWGDIEIPSIDQRIQLLEIVNQIMPRIAKPMIETRWCEENLPLKFLNMITDFPDYSFGQPLYIKSQIFYTHLIEITGRLYLEKDLEFLDKIDAQDMGTYTPIARYYIRKKNIENKYFHDKYFNEDFHLHKFTMKLIDKFIPGATWRWIEDKHKLHIHAVKWCKILMEYCLVNDDEIEEIFHALYLKIQTFKFLEKNVNEEMGKVDEKIINAWSDGLKAIREYYCEILVLYLFQKQDSLLISMLKNIYMMKRKLSLEEMKNYVNFNKGILFEEEFGRKMMDVLFNYILSQNTINTKLITSRKIEDMVTNLMYCISNTNDLFLEGMKLIKEEDYQDFCEEECGFAPPHPFIQNDFYGYFKEFEKIKLNSTHGLYLYKEENVIKDMVAVLTKIDNEIKYNKSIELNEKRNYAMQRVIFNSNVHLIINILMSNYIEYSTHFSDNPSQELFSKYTNLIRYYLNSNTENHCAYFVEVNYWSVENMFYKFPEETSKMIYDIVNVYPQVFLTKEYLLDVTHDMLTKHLKEVLLKTPDVKNWRNLSRIVDIVKLFTKVEYLKIFHWIPEYDIRIVMEEMAMDDMINPDEYERLLKECKNDKDDPNDAKLDYYMNFLSLVNEGCAYRYVQSSLKKVHLKFPAKRLATFFPLAGNNLKYRIILMDFYSNYHVDFKNHLMNNRSDYFCTRPSDMQYEEDPYVDHFYDVTIQLFIDELNYLIERYHKKTEIPYDEQEYFYYFNSCIFGSIVKLMKYYLVIRESLLEKINKYIPDLEKLSEFLYKNRMLMLSIFGVELGDLESPTKVRMELELAKVDTKFKLKREKMQVLGLSKTILEICEKIMVYKPLSPIKKKLLSTKSSIDRIKKVIMYYETFSTNLSIKKKHIDLPFFRIKSGKEQNSNGEIPVMTYIIAFYEQYKFIKMSVDAESNIYLISLNEQQKKKQRQESEAMSYNLCCFFHNQLKKDWYIDKKNGIFSLLESLCNFLFISTKSIQKSFFKVLSAQSAGNETIMMNSCWSEMKWYQSFIKFKTNIDKIWKETYKRVLLLIKFHQFVCEDNNEDFKGYFATKILKADSIDRTQRLTTIFQKLSDNFQWHYNYEKGEISEFDSTHRPHLLVMATGVFELLAELCTGPSEINFNSKKIYAFIFDRYTGFLKRYIRDVDSEFYRAKLALLEFFLTLIEGLDPEILNYQVTNMEIANVNMLMGDSLKQAYFCIVKKDPFTKKKMSDYTLKMNDYDNIINAFQTNEKFAKHTLIQICLKIFIYIKTMGEAKSKYDIFCKERDEMLDYYERNKKIYNKVITEEDLVTYKFVKRVLIKIEIKLDKNPKLTPYYFTTLSQSFFLSQTSKDKFLDIVDRDSIDSKLSGFVNYTHIFKTEMDLNYNRFKNKLYVYKYLNGHIFWYIEVAVMCLSIINNLILLIGFRMNEDQMIDFHPNLSTTLLVLAIIEICLTGCSLIIYLYMNYPLEKARSKQMYLETHAGKKKFNIFDQLYVNFYLALFQQNVILNLYHIIFVILGISYSYAFYSIDILAIVSLSPTMQYIIKSVTKHINQLILTLVLAAVIMFAYGIFIHMYFVSDLDNGPVICSTLSHCYFTIIDRAFRNGEGIGSILGLGYYGDQFKPEGGDPKFYGTLFVNLSFFLFINIILLNIILAILVDTFSLLRERSENYGNEFSSHSINIFRFLDEDTETKCFICNNEKYQFAKAGLDFEKHRKEEHNIWDYLNFLIIMSQKTEKDCTGIEDEIFNKIKKGINTWLPIKRSITLGN